MKNITSITLGVVLLLAGSLATHPQRQYDRTGRNPRGAASYGDDPRTATNVGIEIITINNIFNPSRVYVRPNTNRTVVVPTYTFTLTGVMTYGANDVGYGFFSGNAVSPTRGYMASDTINGYKITAITNNTVKLMDTNNQEYTLRVGAGFTRRGTTNDWRFMNVPEPALSPVGSSMSSGSDSGLSGAASETMRRLMARRAAEEGTSPDAAAPDAAPPAPDGPAPDGAAPPPPPDRGAPPAPPADSSSNSPNNSNPTPAPAN